MDEKVCAFDDVCNDVSARALGSRDNLFDLGADFAGTLVPRGTIVVKLIDKLSRKTRPDAKALSHGPWHVYSIVTGARLSLLTRSTSSLNGSMPAS
ncbi:MAG: hypothetical protein J0H27_16285 [Xanthomonadales bacterium]|nr:hypothetical protein [Xanthomonadales bacterium]ODU91839.1 MAG: hypothetical protein ABT18_14370 [Rhodanobacter sp. SCN 66-43]OJY84859.1 MAG: hypothetical protein BGP23_02330 [Xanthomonadales bacterium 66-474]